MQEDPKKQKMLFTRHKTHSILSRFVSRRSLSNKNDEWLKAAQKELRGRDVSEVRALENVDVVASLSLSLCLETFVFTIKNVNTRMMCMNEYVKL